MAIAKNTVCLWFQGGADEAAKAARDEGWTKIMADPRMKMDPATMPFDGKRMIHGGFAVLLEA